MKLGPLWYMYNLKVGQRGAGTDVTSVILDNNQGARWSPMEILRKMWVSLDVRHWYLNQRSRTPCHL